MFGLGTIMKFIPSCFFVLSLTLFMSALAYSNASFAINTVKANQQSKQKLRINSSQQAAQMAKSRFGGKVLKVQKQKSSYRVKLIKADGHIVSVAVDEKTGRMSGGK